MNPRRAISSMLAAQDPAHARGVAAVAVTTGVLLSALFGRVLIRAFAAEPGLLAMSIFLSMQAGAMVKDATARARVLTTALLIPAVVASIGTAALLSAHRSIVVGGFILIAGAAIWIRRYGPRAAAAGSLTFMAYFFTLFMRPTAAELPVFALVAAGAVAAQLIVRTALLLKRPRRELEVLLRELRAGSAAAVRASSGPASERRDEHSRRALRGALARLDGIGRAIATWQHQFQTDHHVNVDEQTLAERALDARVDTEEVCEERARRCECTACDVAPNDSLRQRRRAESALSAVLDERATPYRLQAARDVAEELLSEPASSTTDAETYLLARSTTSHARLRDIELTREARAPDLRKPPVHRHSAGPINSPHAAPSKTASASRRSSRAAGRRWVPWRQWEPTTRMAVQAMIAATLAAGIGEAISASRWYWAVMTAFVVFIGATTRSSILTRAYRRIAGTVIGILGGVGVVALAGTNADALVIICVVAVFGMLYFGPLNYLYSAAFTTAMLVALYRMLGVLDGSLLELRLVETISGAVIGVLCAYLILSTNSRNVLLANVDAYFDSLDDLLGKFRTKPSATPAALLTSLQELEAAQANLDQTVASMSAALIVGNRGGSHGQADAIHMMFIATRAAARLTQALIRSRVHDPSAAVAAHVVDSAVQDVRLAASATRAVLHGDNSVANRVKMPEGADQVSRNATRRPVIDQLRNLPPDDVASREALLALARIESALHGIDRAASDARHV